MERSPVFYLLFGASRPIQHNKVPKPGDRGRDTEGFRPHGQPYTPYSLSFYSFLLLPPSLPIFFFLPPLFFTIPSSSLYVYIYIYSPPLYNSFFLLFHIRCWFSFSLSPTVLLLVEGGECLLRLLLFGHTAVSYPFIFTSQSVSLSLSPSRLLLHPLCFSLPLSFLPLSNSQVNAPWDKSSQIPLILTHGMSHGKFFHEIDVCGR